MTLVELKNHISLGKVPDGFLVLVNKDNKFLSAQYISAMKKLSNHTNNITSIYEPQQSSLCMLTESDDTLNLLYTETFSERAEDYSLFTNTIVICEQIDKTIEQALAPFVIKLPKFETWHIEAYAKQLCPALDDSDITWLVSVTKQDIDRITNELSKISVFDKAVQKEIFSAIQYDIQNEQYDVDLFTIVNALIDGDRHTLYDFVRHSELTNIEPVVLANRATVSLKNIILVLQNPELSADDCGVSQKQLVTIRRKYSNLNIEAAKLKLKFLTEFDIKLKTSRLELSKRDMLSYLLNNLCYKITR